MNKEKKIASRATRLVWGLIALLATGVAQATLLVQEGFDYPTIATIDGTQNGGTGFLAGSNWGTSNAGISSGLSYLGLSTSGVNALKWTADSRHQRSLASAIGGSTLYLSMLINDNANSARFGMEFPGTSGPCFGHVNGGWGFFGGVNGVLGITNSLGNYQTWLGVPSTPDALTHLIIFKLDYAANAIKLYVDPLPAVGEPMPSATLVTGGDWTVALDSATWSAIATFFSGGVSSASIDELRIGTTWADVAPVNSVATTTDSWWTNVTEGASASWGDSNNWVNTAGENVLPGPGNAFLTVSGGSYTARYDSTSPAISNLTVENSAAYTADLILSAPLTSLGGAAIRLKAGARVTVAEGGVWNYVGVNGTTDRNESMFSIRNGGELNVAGGEIAFTNMPVATGTYGNYFNVGYMSTGTLNVTSGLLEYYDNVPATTNNYRALYIGRGVGGYGTMNVTGGAVLLGRRDGGAEVLGVGSGSGGTIGTPVGQVVVSGGLVAVTNRPGDGWNLLRVGANYGYGVFVVTNTGTVNLKAGGVSSRVHIGTTPYGNGTLRMDGGYMTVGDGITAGYANGYAPPVWATGVVAVTAGKLDAGAGFVLGYGEQGTATGVGEASISGGELAESFWGVFIGRARTGANGIGSFSITNGLLNISSSCDPETYGAVPNGGSYSGLAVGAINYNETDARTRAWGVMTVSGSAVITNAGVLAIGVNGATGTLVQTGGTIRHVPNNAVTRKYSAIGLSYGLTTVFGGGNGTYELSGGSYDTPNPTYIGGVPTNILFNSRSGSTGLLKILGGSFTVTNNTLMVGGYGTGIVTIGSNGVCFAKEIIFTNNTQSTLRCELGTEGLGTLTASSNLVICAGAKLEVNTTAYQGKAVWVKLADCVTRTGSFDPANITITGQGEVKQDRNNDQDVWLFFRRGTMIGIL